MKKTHWMLAALITTASLTLAVAEPTYIGAAKCKMCHKTEYTSWEGLAHAKAIERLKPEEQSKAECLKCHATGGSAEMPGVQCEACHGPGSEYKSMSVMKDREKAIAAGLTLPDKDTCLRCHTGAPHEQKPFDFDTAKEKGVHEFKKQG
jgi:nitrate/TMAO reductase-like tetraheme cytochrome c subunit